MNWLGSLVKLYPISLHIGMEISSHCPGSPAAVLASRRMGRMDRDVFMVRPTRHQLQFIVCLLATGPDCAGRTASSEPASSESVTCSLVPPSPPLQMSAWCHSSAQSLSSPFYCSPLSPVVTVLCRSPPQTFGECRNSQAESFTSIWKLKAELSCRASQVCFLHSNLTVFM